MKGKTDMEHYSNSNPNNHNPFEQHTNAGTYYVPPIPQTTQLQPEVPIAKRSIFGNKNIKQNRFIIALIVVCTVIICISLVASISFFAGKSSGSSKSETGAASAQVQSIAPEAEKDNEGALTAVGVAKKSKASCVGISVFTEQQDFYSFYNFGNSPNSQGEKVASGEGSGVIMSEANGKTYIMTCAHVIEGGSSFKVTLDNNKEYDATMVGYDSQTDIGVLSIEATGLQIATFGDSKDIEVGAPCIAIGCPGGLTFKNSVTSGIVSALDVPVSSSIGYKNECIQVDAAINPGNSGGALFNMQGQVIGINSSKIAAAAYEGMGFAVPSNTAVETANSLIKNGYVAGRAKLGIQYNTLSNYTSSTNILAALSEKGFENAQGAMVIQTIEDESDLKNKDIKQYDMIVAVNGETLTSVDVMTSLLSKHKPGDTIKLTIARVERNEINIFETDCKLVESKQ